MYIAVLRLELVIADSPKAKRRTVQEMLDKLHQRFNVSVAEVETTDDVRVARFDHVAQGQYRLAVSPRAVT